MDRLTDTAALFDGVAPRYDTVVPFFATFAKHLVAAAGIAPGERVLDLACGRGAVLHAPGRAVRGVDVHARTRADEPVEVGFAEAATTTVEERFAFTDVDHFLDWQRSHAGRLSLDGLTDDELATYRDGAGERLAATGHELAQAVDLTLAR